MELKQRKISVDHIDLRVLQPLRIDLILESIKKTGKLLVVDGGWKNGGFAAEIISSVCEAGIEYLRQPPMRLNIANSPAPTSSALEVGYYINPDQIIQAVEKLMK